MKTISAACVRARSAGGAKIVLADGVYEEPLILTRADSNLVFEAAEGASPVISAGRRITGWRVDEKGWWRAPVRREAPLAQLYVGGQRRTRPFLPRKGYHYVEDACEADAATGRERFICRAGDFPDGDNPGMEVCIFHVWTMSRSTVLAYDPSNRIVSLDIKRFTNSYDRLMDDRWYRFDNVRSALGDPGDWYHDVAAGELIYVPMPGETPERCVVTAAWHRHAVRIDGAANIVFRGIVFAYADYGVQKGGNYMPQAAANQPGALHAEAAKGIRLEGCAVLHTGAYGAVFTHGSDDCAAESCEFADLGAGGLRIGDGGDDHRPIEVSQRCVVRDCIIEGGGRVDPAGVGIWVGHGAKTLISHNTIHDMYYSGISVGWNWNFNLTAYGNTIEWNHIYDIGQRVLSDMGGIYLLGRQPGTVERFNHIHHIETSRHWGFGVYFDSGTSGVTVSNSVVHDCSDSNFFCARISATNRVENNIFGYGHFLQISTPPRSKGAPSIFAHNLIVWEKAHFASYLPDEHSMIYSDNLYWCDADSRPDSDNSGFTLRDPGFVDPAARDFRLKDESVARSAGFVPFSIEGCGRTSPRRFTVVLPNTPPVFFPAPEPLALPAVEDFESVKVGRAWPKWNLYPDNAKDMVRVTDATAAHGRKSLEVRDEIGGWQPHMWHEPTRLKGIQRISFSLKVEKGAMPQFEVRERDGTWQRAPGPEVHVAANGDLIARGRRLMTVPTEAWFNVELEFELGKDSSAQGFKVSVKLPNEDNPRVFPGNPLHRGFRAVHWIGFMSQAQGGVRYWIDDFRLHPVMIR